VVNAGSNDVSVFKVNRDSNDDDHLLTLTDKSSSGGVTPISVTINDGRVYVLNAGTSSTPGNIAGFYLNDDDGTLSPISGSIEPLSGITQPAEISFNPHGTVLLVTEKSTNLIDSYSVNEDGVASGPITNPSNGMTPFGFAFDKRGDLIVSEAAKSGLSSYSVSRTGILTTISGSIPDGGAAACWVVVTGNGRYAYTANAHTNTISSYTVNHRGTIALLQSVATMTDAGPNDMALSMNSKFLYVFDSGAHEIQGFRVQSDGELIFLQTVSGIPAGADGLAAN
jgi:6-phosphogluconolactonase (cycloisomerase 2 family)